MCAKMAANTNEGTSDWVALVEYTQTRFSQYSFLSILSFHRFVIGSLVSRESWLRVATPLEWGIFKTMHRTQ